MRRNNPSQRKFVLVGGLVLTLGAVGGQVASGQQDSVPPRPRLSQAALAGRQQILLDNALLVRQTDAAVEQLRTVEVTSPADAGLRAAAPVTVMLWTETIGGQTRPFYAISLDGQRIDTVREADYTLNLRSGVADPTVREITVAPDLRSAADETVFIVQFVTQSLAAYTSQLEAVGARVHGFLPYCAHVVSMTPAVRAAVEALPFVRWVGPYHPSYRLEKEVAAVLRDPAGTPTASRYRVQVFDNDGRQMVTLADAISGLGGTVHEFRPEGTMLHATLTIEQLRQVVRRPEVMFIARWGPPVTLMTNVRADGGFDYVESVAGYSGAGVRGEVMDDGCQIDHPAWTGRIIERNGPSATLSHGSATFGTIFGDGAGGNPGDGGLMPDAVGVFATFGPTNRYADSAALLSNQCVFQSNSWGSSPFVMGQYTGPSLILDRVVFDYDVVILQAMGNYNDQTSLQESWGKNTVGVGGIFHNDTASLDDDVWDGPGSNATIGPALDGRIKPDLAYWYDAIRTTTTGSSYTNSFGGTSAATPQTAGYFGLFFQMWADELFGNDVSASTVFGSRAHAATAKAVMINTADAYPFSGLSDDLTRMHQGWGRADIQRVYDLRDNLQIIDETDVLTPFETNHYAAVIDPAQPLHDQLRVTLVYTDPPGMIGASIHRVNDLTLKVIAPSGSVYWGNAGLDVGNESQAGGAPDAINNVENVFITAPETGAWRIEVTADEINEDGHPETTGVLDADYALVISGGDKCTFAEITATPQDAFVCAGDPVALSATAINETELAWYKDGQLLPGETTSTLTIEAFAAADAGEYTFAAINECGPRFVSARLSELAPSTVISPPSGSVRCAGDNLTLFVQAGGVGPFTYQWTLDGVPIPGETNLFLSVAPLGPEDAGMYRCEIANTCGATTVSAPAMVSVEPIPTVVKQPVDTCGEVGATIQLEFEVTADVAFAYEWRQNGILVGNGPVLTLNNLQTANGGLYQALAYTFNPVCIAYSDAVTLTVGGCPTCPTPGDFDGDNDHDLADLQQFALCFGAGAALVPGCECANLTSGDDNVDLADWFEINSLVNGPSPN